MYKWSKHAIFHSSSLATVDRFNDLPIRNKYFIDHKNEFAQRKKT